MRKVELLAPVGSWESLYAAINAGCDAVYLGGYMFGARQFAPNFSNDELKELINVCHIYGVKVYITANTLIKESEVETFLDFIDFLHINNVDAIIMQDLGMIDLVRKTYPNLEIHASTQLHVHNLEGVKFCEQLGLKRVVLARETDIDSIKKIKKETEIEIEAFIHGALCVSYSGQCLMSSLIGGRSGNRGACAGTCRLPYKLVSKNGQRLNQDDYVLSMKDLCTLEHIKDLIESGIDSFKIEGRMKRPEYVYLVVSLYRKAIDSYYETGKVFIDEKSLYELKKIFNRKFTSGFLFNETNDNITNSYRPNHLGVEIGKVIEVKNDSIMIKLFDDLNVGDGIRIVDCDEGCTVTTMFMNGKKVNCAKKNDVITLNFKSKTSKNSMVVKTTDINQINRLNEKITKIEKKIRVKCKIELKVGKPIMLQLSDSVHSVLVNGVVVESAKTVPLSQEIIERQIGKMGDSPFVLENIEINADENIYVNNKDLNGIRRLAIKELIDKRSYSIEYLKESYEIDVPDFSKTKNISVLLENSEFYHNIKNTKLDRIYCDDINLIKNNYDDRLILKVPRVIEQYSNYEYPVMIGEVGGLGLSNASVGDFSLNVFNSYTVAFLHHMGINLVTLSYELTKSEIKDLVDGYKSRYLKSPNLEVLIYGREEMMISKFSLNRLYKNDDLYLIDRFGKKYPIREKNRCMYIYNYKPRIDENIQTYYNMGINSIRINIFDSKDLLWYLSKRGN